MTDEKRLPWFKFYPDNWRADADLARCSLEARGLWIEMIVYMAGVDRVGYMVAQNGASLTPSEIAGVCRTSPRTAARLLNELELAGVFSRDSSGVIFSRKLVSDFAKSQKHKEHGKKGGNPQVKAGVNPEVKPGVKHRGQRPEDRIEINPPAEQPSLPRVARSHTNDQDEAAMAEARSIIATFDDEIVAHFGPERQRIAPAANDFVHAQRLVAAGWTAKTTQPVFEGVLAQRAASRQEPIKGLAWFAQRFADLSVGTGTIPPQTHPSGGHGSSNGGHPPGWVDWQNDPAEVAWTKAFDEWCRLPKKVRETQKKPVVEDFHHLRAQKAS